MFLNLKLSFNSSRIYLRFILIYSSLVFIFFHFFLHCSNFNENQYFNIMLRSFVEKKKRKTIIKFVRHNCNGTNVFKNMVASITFNLQKNVICISLRLLLVPNFNWFWRLNNFADIQVCTKYYQRMIVWDKKHVDTLMSVRRSHKIKFVHKATVDCIVAACYILYNCSASTGKQLVLCGISFLWFFDLFLSDINNNQMKG